MKILLLFLLLTPSFSLLGQEESLPKSSDAVKYYDSSVPNELHTKISDFFRLMIRGDIRNAYSSLLKNSPLLEKDKELAKLIDESERATKIYGSLLGFEPVDAEIASNSLIKLRYIGLYTKYPLRWIFTYYKSPEFGWTITNIKFDDQSDYLFKTN